MPRPNEPADNAPGRIETRNLWRATWNRTDGPEPGHLGDFPSRTAAEQVGRAADPTLATVDIFPIREDVEVGPLGETLNVRHVRVQAARSRKKKAR